METPPNANEAKPSHEAKPSKRSPGLDAVRALAVVAMVFGHTADGLLSDSARALPAVQAYWTFRGLTAPLFLFVAGWAVMASVERSRLNGAALLRKRLPRVALLLFIGYALRFPGWDLRGLLAFHHDVWSQLLGFDALHCIAISLLTGLLVLALTESPRARTVIFGILAVGVPLLSGALVRMAVSAHLWLPLRQPVVADASSPFPLLPWAAYFFAGAFCAQLLRKVSPRQGPQAIALLVVGAALTWICFHWGRTDVQTSPALFGYRLGQVLVLASGAMALPMILAARLSLLGRSSLTVYVAHLPMVYGWGIFSGLNARWGRSLSLLQVAGVAFVLLVFGLAVAEAIRAFKAWRARPPAQRGPAVPAAG